MTVVTEAEARALAAVNAIIASLGWVELFQYRTDALKQLVVVVDAQRGTDHSIEFAIWEGSWTLFVNRHEMADGRSEEPCPS